jgi:hypothetical protein
MARRTAVRPNISLTLWEEGELHLAHTPLSHAVREGLGVRAKRFALTPCVPLSRWRERGNGKAHCRAPQHLSHPMGGGRATPRPYTPLPQRGRGAGGEGETMLTRLQSPM